MRKLHLVLLAVTAVCTLIVASAVILLPDHTGVMRTELEIGDFYTVQYTRSYNDVTYTIVGMDEDGNLDVEAKSNEASSIATMTKEQFLEPIYYMDNGFYVRSEERAILETNFGERTCTLYTTAFNSYWIDRNNVIYRSFAGGVGIELIATSLFHDGPPIGGE